jgi:hypothetical protein
MQPTFSHRLYRSRAAVWLACWCVLVSALAPTVSRALAAAGLIGADTIEVCTSAGLRRIAAPLNGQTPAEPASLHLDHCPYCVFQATTSALPGTPAVSTPALPYAHVLVGAVPIPSIALAIRPGPLARAPPLPNA